MKPEQLLQVKELFLAASELPPDQRLAWLDQQGVAEGPVREMVLAQLHRLESEPVDLVSPLAARSADPDPETIGPYQVLSRIAEGGMGVVYRAEQSEPVRRVVAVKRIKLGMDSRAVLARFEAERQALAVMDHPCIAKVFDAGTDAAGRPYFAMEFVDGLPINEFCDREQLGLDARLQLFVAVCRGVEHAHRRGVIHRDLKPGNVLVTVVDGVPVPKIIDFGVAKAIDVRLSEHTLQTHFGLVLGTPEYMSPEQADPGVVDIDTRSDVYSLGVLLYELLSGELPFDAEYLRARGFAGILQALLAEEPRRPSARVTTAEEQGTGHAARRGLKARTLSLELRGELDWIALRALRRQRDDRYESASALAADVERYLCGEAVMAGPPTWSYRWSRYARRHRGRAVAAALVALSMVVGTLVSLRFAFEAAEEAHAASLARDAADASAREARAQRDVAQRVTDFLSGSLGFFALDGVRDPSVGDGDFLDHIQAEAEARFGDQPDVVASVFAAVGSAQWTRGDMAAAKRSLERALEIRDASPSTTALQLHELLRPYSWVTWQTGVPESTVWNRCLHNATLAMTELLPDLEQDLRELASWSQGSGFALDDPEAVVGAILERAAEDFDTGDARWVMVGDYLFGCAEQATHIPADETLCDRMHAEVIRCYLERAALPESHIRIALARETHLYAWYEQGRYEQAEQVARETLEALRSALPGGHWYPNVFRAYLGSSIALQEGRQNEAGSLLDGSCQPLLAKLGESSPVALFHVEQLVEFLDARGESERAASLRGRMAAGVGRMPILNFAGTLSADYAVLGPENARLVEQLRGLETMLEEGAQAVDRSVARQRVEAVLRTCEETFAVGDDRWALVSRRLCSWGWRFSNAVGGLSGLDWLVPMFELCLTHQRSVGARLMALTYIADIRIAQGRPVEAERAARDAVAVAVDIDHPIWMSVARRLLGEALVAQERLGEGIQQMEEGYLDLVGWSAPTSNFELLAFLRYSRRSVECGAARRCAELAVARLRELLRGGAPAGQLNTCVWAIVRVPGLSAEAYDLALRGMRKLAERQTLNASQENTLGVAELRCGHHQQAERALLRSEQLGRDAGLAEEPGNTLFLAMAYHHMGRSRAAAEHLQRARKLLSQDGGEPSAELAALVREAEGLLP